MPYFPLHNIICAFENYLQAGGESFRQKVFNLRVGQTIMSAHLDPNLTLGSTYSDSN